MGQQELQQRGQEMKKSQAYNVVGRPEPRLDGADKVTGKAIYTVDVELPGMAHGKILRSPYAHARIKRSMGAKRRRFRESMRLSLATIREDWNVRRRI